MLSPELYTIRKFTIKDLYEQDFDFQYGVHVKTAYEINQQDNMLFRQIRLITGNVDKYNPYVVFVDCKSMRKKPEVIEELLLDGFYINGVHFSRSERSASMVRQCIFSFVDTSIIQEINEVSSMGLNLSETVISKWLAYRGLMFSSCFCLENWIPKVIVVSDYETVIPNQHIKYMVSKEAESDGRKYIKREITEGYKDIPIMPFDGCGIHHPAITKQIKENIRLLSPDTSQKAFEPTSAMWRFPFVKGVTHEFDYTKFLAERNVTYIQDIWGVEHDINDEMIILTKSMYKGFKYFQQYSDSRDWQSYWKAFKKYNHVIGVSKWNNTFDNEPVYTRLNYQILQDLNLDSSDFISLAYVSMLWADKIINGDLLNTYCFLGLTGNNPNPQNDFCKAILKNSEMLKEESVRNYLVNLLKKYLDDFKCGKLWLKSSFRILTPDLIMFAEHIGGLEPKGVLAENEFFSHGVSGVCTGEWMIERNPHICASEHVILNGSEDERLIKYCGHLQGITMVNGKSIVLQRLNGADVDGDLVLTIKHDTMMRGIDRTLLPVIDIEDKQSAPEKEVTEANIVKSILLTLENRIGEYSNIATGYHNKCAKTNEQKQKYMDYVNLVSVLNAKEIDFAKTGFRVNCPSTISKYSKPLPYFMRYAGNYYRRLKNLNQSHSNMNKLCKHIEKWQKSIRFKRKYKDFDYKIMQDLSMHWDSEKYSAVEQLYLEFEQSFKTIYQTYKSWDSDQAKVELVRLYEKSKAAAYDISPNNCELANYAVDICYSKYPSKRKRFIWVIAGEGILKNLKQQKSLLPFESHNGCYEYLGKKYDKRELVFNVK